MNEEIIKNLLKKQIHTNPVDIIEFDKRKLLKMLHDMVLIRKVENQLAKEKIEDYPFSQIEEEERYQHLKPRTLLIH